MIDSETDIDIDSPLTAISRLHEQWEMWQMTH